MSDRSEGGLVVARGLAPATLLATLRLRGLLRRLLATETALLAAGLTTLATLRSGPTGRPGVVLLAAEPPPPWPPKPPPEPPRSALVTLALA